MTCNKQGQAEHLQQNISLLPEIKRKKEDDMQSKNWISSKESKKITTIICIICMVLFVQFIATIYFNKKIYDTSLEHTIQQVEELSKYVKKIFQLEIEHNVHILKNMELQLETEDDILSQQFMKFLQESKELSHFKMVGISDLDGNGFNSTGNKYTITYDHIREYIENNQVYISNVLKNENEVLIFIAVPLKVKDEINGILW